MDLTRSKTVQIIGLVGVVITAASAAAIGWLAGVAALTAVAVVAAVGVWHERNAVPGELVRFEPAAIGGLDAIVCGVAETAPSLRALTDALDGRRLLQFVSRVEARAVARELGRAVEADRSVVVALIGEAKTGKTRCLFEAVRQKVPAAVLFAPRPGPDAVRAVKALKRFGSAKRWSVLWLDGLDRFIDPVGGRGVDDDLLDELVALPRVIVAITAATRWGLEHLDNAATLGRLIPGPEHDARQIASVLGERLAAAVGDEGLGAACVAGPSLLHIHDSGQHPGFDGGEHRVVEGQIVVECLIAAAQLGLGSLTRAQLADVYAQTGTVHAAAHSFDRGLRWATTALYGEVALVIGDDDAYRAYPYVAENAAPVGEYRISAERVLAATIAIDDLLAMAGHARDAFELEYALRLYELALPRIDETRHAAVIHNIGLAQRDLGRFTQALGSLQRALAIEENVYGPDHHEVAITLTNLGIVQEQLGKRVQAEANVRRALGIFDSSLGTDHPFTRQARRHLAQLVSARGEVLLNIRDDGAADTNDDTDDDE